MDDAAPRRRPLALFLWVPLVTLLGYAAVLVAGMAWPERVQLLQGLGIGWMVGTAIAALMAAFATHRRWVARLVLWVLAPGHLLLMLGPADLGPALAMEQRCETVQGRVVSVKPYKRENMTSSGRTTTQGVIYNFSVGGRPLPGEINYRGSTQGYGFAVGDRVPLCLDKQGKMPFMVKSEVDPTRAKNFTVTGVVLLLLGWGVLGIVYWAGSRRQRRQNGSS